MNPCGGPVILEVPQMAETALLSYKGLITGRVSEKAWNPSGVHAGTSQLRDREGTQSRHISWVQNVETPSGSVARQ